MAMVMAAQRWRPYLLGQRFIIHTDQRAWKFLLELRVIQPQYQCYLSKLLGYDFEVQYKPGLENKVADALSRLPPTAHLAVLLVPSIIDVQKIQEEVLEDPKLIQIIEN